MCKHIILLTGNASAFYEYIPHFYTYTLKTIIIFYRTSKPGSWILKYQGHPIRIFHILTQNLGFMKGLFLKIGVFSEKNLKWELNTIKQ